MEFGKKLKSGFALGDVVAIKSSSMLLVVLGECLNKEREVQEWDLNLRWDLILWDCVTGTTIKAPTFALKTAETLIKESNEALERSYKLTEIEAILFEWR